MDYGLGAPRGVKAWFMPNNLIVLVGWFTNRRNTMRKLGSKLAFGLLAAGLATTGCQNGDLTGSGGPSFAVLPSPGTGNGVANFEEFELCKYGSSATFSYSVTTYGGAGKTLPGAPQTGTISLNDGECRIVALYGGFGADVTVSETGAQSGFHLDRIDVSVIDGGGTTKTSNVAQPVTEFISGTGGGGLRGALAEFFNVANPSEGGEGCTPGYWKQEQHFDSWPAGYLPGDLFSKYFEDAFPGKTLLFVLWQGGGGLNALGRHAVSALLNAASSGVDYDLSVQQVINGFNGVFPGGDYEGQKNIFAGFNEQTCPLN